jgi:hypothetical protein
MTIFLAVVLLVSMVLSVAPASAVTSGWEKETIPGDDGFVIAPGDIVDLAVAADGVTMYAATGTTVLYQTSNAGVSWRLRYLPLGINTDYVAVAPDAPNIIVVLDDTSDRGFISMNYGFTFSELPAIPAGIYNDLAVSPEFTNGLIRKKIEVTFNKKDVKPALSPRELTTAEAIPLSTRYIGIVGSTTGNDDPFFYYCNVKAISPTWINAVTSAAWSGWSGVPYSEIDELKTVAFSPKFVVDKTALLVSEENGSSTGARFHAARFNTRSWDTTAGFIDYPVDLVSLSGTTVSDVNSASVSPAPDYLGTDENQRLVFIGLAIVDSASAEQGGLMRLNDSALTTLKSATAIYSIAYDGTNLVAGATTDATGVASTEVYRSADPTAISPTVRQTRNLKRPGGTTAVIVAWANADVVAGTSGNESAFAISRNNGESFNDISLIDTTLATLEDVAVSPEGSMVYLVSDDGTDLSLWRYASHWERVLSLQNETDYVVHIAPENPAAVYLFKKNSPAILYSNDSGETRWYQRNCNIIPVDVAIQSAEVLYALNSAGYVSRSNNTGFTWSVPQDTTLGSGATITGISENNLIVGSADGYVAYSRNGNITWTKLSAPIAAGEVHVTADGLATSNYIYAVSGVNNDYVYRWKIVPSTTDWTRISPALGADFMCYDIVLSDGALYVLGYDTATTVSTVHQALKPYTGKVVWDLLPTDPGVKFTNSPKAMVITDQLETRIWAIDSYVVNNHNLYSYISTKNNILPGR